MSALLPHRSSIIESSSSSGGLAPAATRHDVNNLAISHDHQALKVVTEFIYITSATLAHQLQHDQCMESFNNFSLCDWRRTCSNQVCVGQRARSRIETDRRIRVISKFEPLD